MPNSSCISLTIFASQFIMKSVIAFLSVTVLFSGVVIDVIESINNSKFFFGNLEINSFYFFM